MTVAEIKNMVMFQTNNDVDDLADYIPYLSTYIDEGYDRLVDAWTDSHADSDNEDYPPLTSDKSVPATPEWTHKGIADWATWCVYRNGSAPKQSRGQAFRSAFEELLLKIKADGGANGKVKNFFNIPD